MSIISSADTLSTTGPSIAVGPTTHDKTRGAIISLLVDLEGVDIKFNDPLHILWLTPIVLDHYRSMIEGEIQALGISTTQMHLDVIKIIAYLTDHTDHMEYFLCGFGIGINDGPGLTYDQVDALLTYEMIIGLF